MSSMKPFEWAMLVVLSVFWGGSFFFVEVALRGFQPFAIVFLRVVLAALILTAVVYLKKTAPVVNSAGMLICSSVIMLPLVLVTGALGLSQPSAAPVAAVFGLATVSTAMAYLLYFRILAAAGATNVLLVTFLMPVSALLLRVGVLAEVIHLLEYAGMGCIFLGLMVIDGRVLNRVLQLSYFHAKDFEKRVLAEKKLD
ncbi:MAG: DMT family transporter [Desulfobacterales bacterium]|nr:MAG: DMT family transporter [Desulfobacterales bacterium]